MDVHNAMRKTRALAGDQFIYMHVCALRNLSGVRRVRQRRWTYVRDYFAGVHARERACLVWICAVCCVVLRRVRMGERKHIRVFYTYLKV